MPALEYSDLRQWAVVWFWTGQQNRHGQQTIHQPIQIPVRWNFDDAQVLDSFGNTIGRNGDVVAAIDIPDLSMIWYAGNYKLTTLPTTFTELAQLFRTGSTGDIKQRNIRYEYKSMRWGDTLPPLVTP